MGIISILNIKIIFKPDAKYSVAGSYRIHLKQMYYFYLMNYSFWLLHADVPFKSVAAYFGPLKRSHLNVWNLNPSGTYT